MLLKFFEFQNISTVDNDVTARTVKNVALKRAENLKNLGVKRVIELCVGPSLKTLEYYYNKAGINVTGNDIEVRWRDYYPEGDWLMGDSLKIDCSQYDATVFAPPLSKGCSGNRCDYLSIEEVMPSYYDFIENEKCGKVIVLVLPGKTFSLRKDKNEFHKLMNFLYMRGYSNIEAVEMKGDKNKITKYVDVYITK